MATNCPEMPAFIEMDGEELFAILTKPATAPRGIGVVLAWGAGPYPSSGRNRIRAKLARKLAGLGFHVVRFDYKGVGESSGDLRKLDFSGSWSRDILAAANLLSRAGIHETVLVGHCFGGYNVLAASRSVPDLCAVVVVGPPVADQDHLEAKARHLSWRTYLRQVFDQLRAGHLRPVWKLVRSRLGALLGAGGSQRTGGFAVNLRGLLERAIPVRIIYASSDHFYSDYRALTNTDVFSGLTLPPVAVIETPVNLQSAVRLQDEVIEAVVQATLECTADAKSLSRGDASLRMVEAPA